MPPASPSPEIEKSRVWVVELVKGKPGRREQALLYYQRNWLQLRRAAKRDALILSYELLVASDESGPWDLMLMTSYPARRLWSEGGPFDAQISY